MVQANELLELTFIRGMMIEKGQLYQLTRLKRKNKLKKKKMFENSLPYDSGSIFFS